MDILTFLIILAFFLAVIVFGLILVVLIAIFHDKPVSADQLIKSIDKALSSLISLAGKSNLKLTQQDRLKQ